MMVKKRKKKGGCASCSEFNDLFMKCKVTGNRIYNVSTKPSDCPGKRKRLRRKSYDN